MKFVKAAILSAFLVSPFLLKLGGINIGHSYFNYEPTPLQVLIIYVVIFAALLAVSLKKRP